MKISIGRNTNRNEPWACKRLGKKTYYLLQYSLKSFLVMAIPLDALLSSP